MRRSSCVAVSVLAFCVGCAAERTDVRFGGLRPEPRSLDYKPGIATWVLPNKLTVAVMPDDRVNLVSVEVRYTVGGADDPPGKGGLAHLVEHLMFESRGAREVLGQMIRAYVHQVRARFGASYGVRAGYQTTAAGDYLQIDGELDTARAGDALRLIQRALDELRHGGRAIARQLVLARRSALAGALADPMRSGVAADRIEYAVNLGLPIDAANRLPAEIAATTLQDMEALIAQDLDAAHLVAMVSGQPGDVARALAVAGVTGAQPVAETTAARAR